MVCISFFVFCGAKLLIYVIQLLFFQAFYNLITLIEVYGSFLFTQVLQSEF